MSRTNFRATTALGLCLAMSPLLTFPAKAQSFGAGAGMFEPAVQDCIEAPEAGYCEPVQEDVIACSEDLTLARCDGLFQDAEAVFADPALLMQAQSMLLQTREAIEQTGFVADATDAVPDDAAPASDAQEAFAQAGEPAQGEGDDWPVADAEPEAEAEVEAQAEVEAEPEVQAEVEAAPEVQAEAEVDAETEVQAEVDAETEVQAQAEVEAESEGDDAEQRLRQALEAEERTVEGAVAEGWADRPAETDEPQAEGWSEAEADAPETDEADAPEPDTAATDDAVVTEEAEAAPTAAEQERAAEEARLEEARLEEERARLRAEAEAMATEEPELVIDEAPAEEFVAEEEAPRELDAEQRGALDRMMEDPEVAAAVAVLGGAAYGTRAPDDAEAEQIHEGFAAAMSGLRRDRGEEAVDDADQQAAEVIEDEVAPGEARTSREDFESRLALDFDAGQDRRDSRRDLERAGLVALGALAVGMIINQNRVVARSDERVVVQDDRGEYAVWRDDDVILRQEGAQRRIERYEDGSSLSRWDRPDGSQIITIRDATGRVLLRERVLPDGSRMQFVDDMREVRPIDVSTLPPPRSRELRLSQRTDPELALVLLREAEADARALDRAFTLRQVREVREVRELVPVLSTDPITFPTNRANVRAEEAPKLAQIGRLMERLIAENPRALFLVEGHTDATGPASYNLALSDRRAESVALALTEFFEIPPENLIIQGYGERHLRIPTAAAEERNRRVAIRHISPLLGL